MRHDAFLRYAAVLLFLLTAGALFAQEQAAPLPARANGLQVRNVTAYFDYYSSTLPNGLQSTVSAGYDFTGGGSVEVGWARSSERSNSSLAYISSLNGHFRYSELNVWNHALSFTTSYKLVPRWTFGFSARGDLSSIVQTLFAPTTLNNVASTQASFDELASALLASKFTNPQLASVLNGAPLVESPVRNLLYGQRMFTAGVQTSLSYSYSPRLSMTFQAGAGRNQQVFDQTVSSANTAIIPNTTTGSAGVTLSYSLSPQSQIGGSVTTVRTSSSVLDSYTTTSLVSMGWTLARRWVVQLHGGVGVTNPVRLTSVQFESRPHPAAGGALTYRTFEHTFLGSFDRTVSDSYGLGASSTSNATFVWRWSRPGRSWWVETSLGWQQLQGNGLGDTSGLRTTAGFGRTLSAHVALFTQYAYLSYSGRLQQNVQQNVLQTLSSQDQSAMRVSIQWSPQSELLR
jgi:hypothetical protein